MVRARVERALNGQPTTLRHFWTLLARRELLVFSDNNQLSGRWRSLAIYFTLSMRSFPSCVYVQLSRRPRRA